PQTRSHDGLWVRVGLPARWQQPQWLVARLASLLASATSAAHAAALDKQAEVQQQAQRQHGYPGAVLAVEAGRTGQLAQRAGEPRPAPTGLAVRLLADAAVEAQTTPPGASGTFKIRPTDAAAARVAATADFAARRAVGVAAGDGQIDNFISTTGAGGGGSSGVSKARRRRSWQLLLASADAQDGGSRAKTGKLRRRGAAAAAVKAEDLESAVDHQACSVSGFKADRMFHAQTEQQACRQCAPGKARQLDSDQSPSEMKALLRRRPLQPLLHHRGGPLSESKPLGEDWQMQTGGRKDFASFGDAEVHSDPAVFSRLGQQLPAIAHQLAKAAASPGRRSRQHSFAVVSGGQASQSAGSLRLRRHRVETVATAHRQSCRQDSDRSGSAADCDNAARPCGPGSSSQRVRTIVELSISIRAGGMNNRGRERDDDGQAIASGAARLFSLGVTKDSKFQTPTSEYMLPKQRLEWLRQRAGVALFIACHRSHYEMASQLLSSGANVNATTALGRSPLHVAAAKNNGDIINLLLESGADVDLEDKNGQNPLAVAAEFGHKGCERRLFMFRWQQRAKSAKPQFLNPTLKEFQRSDSAYPKWRVGESLQVYLQKVQPPEEFIGTALHAPRRNWHRRSSATPEELLTQRTASGRAISYEQWQQKKRNERRKVIEDERQAREQEEAKRKRQELDQQLAQLTRQAYAQHDGSAGGPGGHALPPIAGHDGQQADPHHPGQQQQRRSAFRQRRLDPRLNAYEQWLKDRQERQDSLPAAAPPPPYQVMIQEFCRRNTGLLKVSHRCDRPLNKPESSQIAQRPRQLPTVKASVAPRIKYVFSPKSLSSSSSSSSSSSLLSSSFSLLSLLLPAKSWLESSALLSPPASTLNWQAPLPPLPLLGSRICLTGRSQRNTNVSPVAKSPVSQQAGAAVDEARQRQILPAGQNQGAAAAPPAAAAAAAAPQRLKNTYNISASRLSTENQSSSWRLALIGPRLPRRLPLLAGPPIARGFNETQRYNGRSSNWVHSHQFWSVVGVQRHHVTKRMGHAVHIRAALDNQWVGNVGIEQDGVGRHQQGAGDHAVAVGSSGGGFGGSTAAGTAAAAAAGVEPMASSSPFVDVELKLDDSDWDLLSDWQPPPSAVAPAAVGEGGGGASGSGTMRRMPGNTIRLLRLFSRQSSDGVLLNRAAMLFRVSLSRT
uniref:ANK_REP_REGION domain-containing protein n=1 Tax=Macrostomum lignano TaxID=282301 RepID=A0A1I8INL7_9PLAT